MQCSILYYLLKSVYCVDCILRQENESTHLLIILCDALILHSSTDPAVRKVQFYMSAVEVTCITGLMIAILILHLMSKYEDLRTACDMEHPTHTVTQIWSSKVR